MPAMNELACHTLLVAAVVKQCVWQCAWYLDLQNFLSCVQHSLFHVCCGSRDFISVMNA